jgi:hypothetical protein
MTVTFTARITMSIFCFLRLSETGDAWTSPMLHPISTSQQCFLSSLFSAKEGAHDVSQTPEDVEDFQDETDDGSFSEPISNQHSSKVEDRDAHVAMLNANLQKWTGRGLFAHMFEDTKDKSLHEWDDIHMSSQFAIMSHGSSSGLSGPIINYANFGTCGVLELPRDKLLQFPAYMVAEPGWDQEEWQLALARLKELGTKYSDDPTRQCISMYSGWRCTLPGQRRFYVRDGVVWNLYDQEEKYVGQAVLFDREKITYNDERLHEFL